MSNSNLTNENLIKELFDKEVAEIRRNPKLGGTWGYLQDYLREILGGKSGVKSANYRKLANGRSYQIITEIVNDKVNVTFTIPKPDCTKLPPIRLLPSEVEKVSLPLPDDLQAIILG